MEPYLERARANLAALQANPYPGRGIVVGLDETGKFLVQVFWIMGRGQGSRNRVFKSDESGRLWTAPADPSKVKDPSLIIYNAMRETSPFSFVVSNGHQTNSIIKAHEKDSHNFWEAMRQYQYEPDKPNFTPRISAMCSVTMRQPCAQMSILTKAPWGNECNRHFYYFDTFTPGIGYCITTYSGDGDPLPAFEGDPYSLPLTGILPCITLDLWEALNPENRVSLAVKFINIKTPLARMGHSQFVTINKYTEV